MDTKTAEPEVIPTRPRKLPRPTILDKKQPRTLPCPVCKRFFSSYDAIDWHLRGKRH